MKVILGVVPDVGDVDGTASQNRPTGGMSPAWPQWVSSSNRIGAFDRRVVDRFQTNEVAPIRED